MISIVVYGRNDSYGYNLHRRAALGLNCMAEILDDPDDEILFVDYNTPDDFPTFPEAIADTLTDKARQRLRTFRVRPAIHARFAARTHLKALEPHARNVAVRRSNPANRWILSTNTDMIFTPRREKSLSAIAAGLGSGFYHLPRFELPESLWEDFDRLAPAAVIERIQHLAPRLFLNEIVYGADIIKYDAPGDFQLILRDDAFRIHGFDENMLLGWHVDSNIAKRLFLIHGAVGDVVDDLFGYHCDHTRQLTPMHQHRVEKNSETEFIGDVVVPELPHQAESWGCAADAIEEIRIPSRQESAYVRALQAVIDGEMGTPSEAWYTPDGFDAVGYDARHVLPFLADLFMTAPRDSCVGWLGARADMFALFVSIWQRLQFRGRILIEAWSAPLLACTSSPSVQAVPVSEIVDAAGTLIIDFGDPSSCDNPLLKRGVDPGALDAAVEPLRTRTYVRVVEGERARIKRGMPARRFITINANHNRHHLLTCDDIAAATTPFSTRLRHGFVTPRQEVELDRPASVLARMMVGDGGRKVANGVLAPFSKRGYVVYGPYDKLLPGGYEVEFVLSVGRPAALTACLQSIVIEVFSSGEFLAQRRVRLLPRMAPTLRFEIPPDRIDGQSQIEFRIFRYAFAEFVVHDVRLTQLTSPPMSMVERPTALLEALGLEGKSVEPATVTQS